MQIISEDKINDIRNNADIVSIISDYIPLKLKFNRNDKLKFYVHGLLDTNFPSRVISRQYFRNVILNKTRGLTEARQFLPLL